MFRPPVTAKKLTRGLQMLALLVLVTGPQWGSPGKGTEQARAGHPAPGVEPSRASSHPLTCLSIHRPVLAEAVTCARRRADAGGSMGVVLSFSAATRSDSLEE